ncbi:TPA: hypothetical protein QDA93_002735 [Burkholderia vietnamiensis]|nr:hypothetical protein [Burkholderia vietnamiensis]
MAITLITGTPGSGKTLYAVSMLRREIESGRRLLVRGIRGLALDHELLADEDVRRWPELVKPQDILVVDECQDVWPTVSVGTKPTDDIAKLNVHRHMGVDIWVITQHPNLINKSLRNLVGRHIHVRRMLGMNWAIVYQWDSARNPGSGFRDAVKSRWSYPKDVFNLYTSAEVHTKPKGVVPKVLWVLPVAIVAAVVFAWRGFHSVSGFGSLGKGGAGAATGASAVAASSAGGSSGGARSWRVGGRYVIDGVPYVLVADQTGRFRSVEAKDFKGDELHVTGTVDGEPVAVWSGALGSAGSVGSGGVSASVK